MIIKSFPRCRDVVKLCFLISLIFIPSLACAQTVPTAHETQVGDPCSNAAHSTDFDTMVQCTSTSSTSGTFQKAPLFAGEVTSPPYSATSCDSSKAGMVQYSGGELQFCNGTAWKTVASTDYVDAGGGGTWSTQTFTTSGTWNYTTAGSPETVNIILVGGGGGGSGSRESNGYNIGGGGGGGGGITRLNNVPVSGNLTVTIGSGGAGGYSSSDGTDGGTSIITGGPFLIRAVGGRGAIFQYSRRGMPGPGGAGATSGIEGYSESGSTSLLSGSGGNSLGVGGASRLAEGNGYDGSLYGGGGGGAASKDSSAYTGGDGANGVAIIWWQS